MFSWGRAHNFGSVLSVKDYHIGGSTGRLHLYLRSENSTVRPFKFRKKKSDQI